MRPIFRTALLALLAGQAWAGAPQGSALPAISQLSAQPASNADVLSLQAEAPRRHMLTTAAGPFNPIYSTNNAGTLYTNMVVLPIEGVASAARIGVIQPWAGTWQIASASIWFSDSYAGLVQPGGLTPNLGTDSANKTVIPTANSVYQTGTLTNGSNQITGLTTAALPSGATMYVIGPTGVPISGTATVTNSSTVTMSGNYTGTTGSYSLQFANLSTECKLYFDNGGAHVDTVNTTPVNRSMMLYGNPSNSTTSSLYPATIAWTDLALCASVARADGGAGGSIAFVYLTQGTLTTNYARGGPSNFNTQTASAGFPGNPTTGFNAQVGQTILGDRYDFSARPWNNGGTDYADNPAGTGWTVVSTAPPSIALQYITDAPGWQIVQDGDSISTSPPALSSANGVNLACKLLSTPQAPCEYFNLAYGGTQSALYQEMLRNNLPQIKPSAFVGQPLSRNDGLNSINLAMLTARMFSYLGNSGAARIGFLGAFPFTTSLDGNSAYQANVAAVRSRLNAISTTCQPNTGGQTCPHIPVLDPVPIVSRAALGGNFWDYLGMGFLANGAAAAGSTTIPITTGGTVSCYPGDVLTDTTTPSAVLTGATVTSATGSALTVANTAVIGPGIQGADQLVCSDPGWTGGALSYDNTHPWYPAITALLPFFKIFVNQLLGLQ